MNTSEYYTEITKYDVHDRYIRFTTSELKYLSKLYPSIHEVGTDIRGSLLPNPDTVFIPPLLLVITDGTRLIPLNIYKLPDEWFIVIVSGGFRSGAWNHKSKYYKCDQLDGLIKLLDIIKSIW